MTECQQRDQQSQSALRQGHRIIYGLLQDASEAGGPRDTSLRQQSVPGELSGLLLAARASGPLVASGTRGRWWGAGRGGLA